MRINPDGSADARASSHNGYNGADAPAVDWASDASGKVPGASAVKDAAEALGLRGERGWTPSQGTLYVSGGSHAGHATEGSLGRELAGLVATERLALSGERPRGPLGPAEERHRQELLANRLSSWLFGPGARTTPRGSVKLIPIESLAGLPSYSLRDQPALAEARLHRPGVRRNGLSWTRGPGWSAERATSAASGGRRPTGSPRRSASCW